MNNQLQICTDNNFVFRKTVNHNGKTLSTDSNVKETYIGLQENIPLNEGINFIM